MLTATINQGKLGAAVQLLHEFYGRRGGWKTLVVTSVSLTYGGGVAMFWLHAIHRGEQGPAINDVAHWLVDSTLGFVGLTPVLFLVVPLAMVAARGRGGRLRVGRYALVVGALFAVVTTPGPLLHGLIAGAGTPLADLVTSIFGQDPQVAARNLHAVHRSPLAEGVLQLLVGLPVYMACAWFAGLTLHVSRAGVVARFRRIAIPMPASPEPQVAKAA